MTSTTAKNLARCPDDDGAAGLILRSRDSLFWRGAASACLVLLAVGGRCDECGTNSNQAVFLAWLGATGVLFLVTAWKAILSPPLSLSVKRGDVRLSEWGAIRSRKLRWHSGRATVRGERTIGGEFLVTVAGDAGTATVYRSDCLNKCEEAADTINSALSPRGEH